MLLTRLLRLFLLPLLPLLLLTGCGGEAQESSPALPGGALDELATPPEALPSPTAAAAPEDANARPAAPQPLPLVDGVTATVTGTLAAGGVAEYTLEAPAGQRLWLLATGASLTVTAPDGTPLIGDAAGWAALLPADGSYTVALVRGNDPGDFRLSALLSAAEDARAPTPLTRAAGAPLLEQPLSLEPGQARSYIFDGQAGEQLALVVDGQEAPPFMTVVGADGTVLQPAEAVAHGWVGGVTVTQAYVVTLYGRDAGDYQLRLIADGLTAGAGPQRVGFPEGSFGTTLAGILTDLEDGDTYLLLAGAGQEMVVTLRTADDSALFTLTGPDGVSLLPADYDGLTHWHAILPAGGEYVVGVATDQANSAYVLDLTITPPVAVAPLEPTATPLQATFATPAGVAAYRVTLQDGQQVSIDVTGDPAPALWVEGPGGYVEPAPTLDRLSFIAVGDGDYLIRLAIRSGAAAGSFQLMVSVE